MAYGRGTSCSSRIFTRDESTTCSSARAWIKDRFKAYQRHWPLQDRTLVMIFEKASTRTRLSFEAGMHQLGGSAIYLNTRDSQLGRGEPVEDAAQVISRMSDIVMIRTFEQEIIERFAANSRVPVINGLTNEYHPCQILADIFTFIEHRGAIQGKTVAWIGDSNNVCNTWLQAAEMLRLQGACVDAAGLRSRARARRPARHRPFRAVRRSDGCRARRRPGDHRRVDLDGLRGRKRGAHARLRRLAGRRRDDARRRNPTPCSCTACPRIAARK
jgi:ornithine carbamoyltransferase